MPSRLPPPHANDHTADHDDDAALATAPVSVADARLTRPAAAPGSVAPATRQQATVPRVALPDAPASRTFPVAHPRITRLACVLAMVAIGWVIGQVSQPGVQSWYPLLSKPALTPPDWLFGTVWTVLYILLGAGLARLLSREIYPDEQLQQRRTLTVYSAQLLANFLWNPIFFIGQSTWLATAWIFVVLWLTVWSLIECLRFERTTALMLVPLIGWLLFACYLMTWIYLNN